MSHRERSKARRREAIYKAAWQLFAAKGYGPTTLADIADAADVSPRTVSIYFPHKADLLMAAPRRVAEGLMKALQARSANETALEAFDRWLLAEGEALDLETATLTAVISADPDTPAYAALAVVMEALTAWAETAIAEITGSPAGQAAVGFLANAVSGVLHGMHWAVAHGEDLGVAHLRAMRVIGSALTATVSDAGQGSASQDEVPTGDEG